MTCRETFAQLDEVLAALGEALSFTHEAEQQLEALHDCPAGTSCPWCGPTRRARGLILDAYLDVRRTIAQRMEAERGEGGAR